MEGEHALDPLARTELQQVRHVLALGVAGAFRHFVALDAIDTAHVGEEKQPVVVGRGEEMLHHVVLAQAGALDALTAAVLAAVVGGERGLDVAGARDGVDHGAVGDEVLVGNVAGIRQDLRAAPIAVLGDDLVEFVAHDPALAGGRVDDGLVVADLGKQLVVLVEDLLSLESGQAAQLHGEDGVRLRLVHIEQTHEAFASDVDRAGGANEADDLVDGVDGLEVALQDMVALLGLALEVLGAAQHDLQLVVDPVAHEAVEAQGARHAIDEGEHVHAERGLQLGVLMQVVEHDFRDSVLLEDEHEALAGAAGGLVAHVGDAFDSAVAHSIADGSGELVGIDLVR